MSLFNELKRRNVFRVGIAYVVAAWLVAQVAELAADSFGAPEWVMKMFITFLALGFPLAMIFAWAFEMTPEGLKREKDVDRSKSITPVTGRKLDRTIIVVLAVALGYFAWDKFILSASREAAPAGMAAGEDAAQADSARADAAPRSIAVLPFVNMSDDAGNEYFSDGLTEELLNILAKIKELRVAGRTSSFVFKGKEEDLRSIGEKLNVTSILEGSVRKDDTRNRVRITVQLINAGDGYHLWSETYDRELEDIFAIQEEIAREVASALRVTLLGEDEIRIAPKAASDLGAYDLYLRGLKLLNEFSFDSMNEAARDFQQAINLDPNYQPAQINLARTWLELAVAGAVPRDEANAKARPIVRSILELDPGHSEAHALMSRIYRFERKPDEARQELQLALDANPRNVEALTKMGRLLFDSGSVSKGMEYLFEAERIDPYAVQVLWDLTMTHAFMLDTAASERYAQRIAEIQPDNPMQYYGPAWAYLFNGEYARSLWFSEKAAGIDPSDYELPAGMASVWIDLGDPEQAEKWARRADELGADQPVPIKARVMLYQYREQYGLAADLARRALDRGLDERQRSGTIFRNAMVSNLVQDGKAGEALELYRAQWPEWFLDSPEYGTHLPFRASDLLSAALLVRMLDPEAPQAGEMIDAAEQKIRLREDAWLPWAGSLNRAAIAAARGDKPTAIKYLLEAWDRNYRNEWHERLNVWIGFKSLHDEPQYRRLIAMLEEDMERQRLEAYELLGIQQ